LKLLPDTNTPACLYRNCIQFSVSGFPGNVTLIDTFTHFEVHVRTASKIAGELCAIVRQAVFTGLGKANLTLGYDDCIPSSAILCPCGGGSTHMATLGKGFWVCKRDSEVYEDLTARHLMWTEENVSRQKGEYACQSVPLYCTGSFVLVDQISEAIYLAFNDRSINLVSLFSTAILT
jgi:hypothetical protein